MNSFFNWIFRHLIRDKANVCSICLDTLDQSILQKFLELVYSIFWINVNPVISAHGTKEHYFHLACIIDWNSRQETCPDCRTGMNTDYFARLKNDIEKSLIRQLSRRIFIKDLILTLLPLCKWITGKIQLIIILLWEIKVGTIVDKMLVYTREKFHYFAKSDIIDFLTTNHTAELDPNRKREEHITWIDPAYYMIKYTMIGNIIWYFLVTHFIKDKNWSWINSFIIMILWMLPPHALGPRLIQSKKFVLEKMLKQHKKIKFLQETEHIAYQLKKSWSTIFILLAGCTFGSNKFPLVLVMGMTLVLGLSMVAVLNIFLNAYEKIVLKY
jgi:hypothetical protein